MNLIQKFKEHRDNLDQLTDTLPYVIHVHDIQNLQLKYVSPNFKNAYVEFVSEDLSTLYTDSLTHVHPNDQLKVKETYLHYIRNAKQFGSINFLQRMRFGAKPDQVFFTTSIMVRETNELLDISTPLSNNEFISKNALCQSENIWKYSLLREKEKQLIQLLIQSKSLKEIARQLDITYNTVKTYKKKIYKKLDIHSLNELFDFVKSNNLN
ncbi:MAG: LuxR C-terminal-related transcriptional regulator [Bacteroidota bacterium]